jgi:hypothetical protein
MMDASKAPAAEGEAANPLRSTVVENTRLHRFELPLPDGMAAAYYREDGNRLVLTHTEVPSEYNGQGVGTFLATQVFEQIRASGRKAVVKCPFMAHFASKHPEYRDIVDG